MDIEKSILKLVADNPPLAVAIKHALLAEFKEGGTAGLTNLELGEITRARLDGIERIENAFKKISQYKTVTEREKGSNPAR